MIIAQLYNNTLMAVKTGEEEEKGEDDKEKKKRIKNK